MKNRVIISMLFAALLTGCMHDLFVQEKHPKGEHDTYMRVKLSVPRVNNITTTGLGLVDEEKPAVHTVRISVFYEDKLTQGFSRRITDPNVVSNGVNWEVEVDEVFPVNSGDAYIFAIFNELAAWTSRLDGMEDLDVMFDFINTELIPYENLIAVESPESYRFKMVAYRQDKIPFGHDRDNPAYPPYEVIITGVDGQTGTFTGPAERTMAKLVIERVSNDPLDSGTPHDQAFLDESSLVFITKIGLHNVPNRYTWQPRMPGGSYPKVSQHGSQNFVFPLPEEDLLQRYYSNNMGSFIEIDINGIVTEIQRAEGSRIWYTGDGAGNNAYSTDREQLTRNVISNYNSVRDAAKQATYPNPSNITLQQFNNSVSLNSGNFPTTVTNIFTNAQSTGNYLPSYVDIAQGGDHEVQLSGDYWELKEKNIAYYIPEHILSDTCRATSIFVEAVKITKEDILKGEIRIPPNVFEGLPVVWTPWQITLGRDDITLADFESNFNNSMDLIWGYELDIVMAGTTPRYIVRHYWDIGAQRSRTGDVKTTIPGGIATEHIHSETAYVRSFYLPISNADDVNDNNIYRNREYNFSIHIVHPWWESGGARSGNDKLPFVLKRNQ